MLEVEIGCWKLVNAVRERSVKTRIRVSGEVSVSVSFEKKVVASREMVGGERKREGEGECSGVALSSGSSLA